MQRASHRQAWLDGPASHRVLITQQNAKPGTIACVSISTPVPNAAFESNRTKSIAGPGGGISQLPPPSAKHWLVRTVFSQRPWSLIGSVGMAISFLCNGIMPVLIGLAIDRGVAESDLNAVLRYGLALVAVGIVGLVAQYTGMFFAMRSELLIAHDLRMALTNRIQDPRGFADSTHSPGDLLSIASTDVNRVARSVIMTVFPVAEISSVIFTMVMLWFIHPYLGIGLVVGIPILIALATKLSQPLRRRSLVRQQRLGQTAAKATDLLQGLRVLRGLAAVQPAQRAYKQQSDAAYKATVGAAGAEASLFAVTQLAGLLFVSALAVVAGLLAVHGEISIGALISAIGLAQFIVTPVTMLGRNIATVWANASASASRITALLQEDYSTTKRCGAQAAAAVKEIFGPGITVVPAKKSAGVQFLELIDAPNLRVAPHTPALFSGTVATNIASTSADGLDPEVALLAAEGGDIPGGISQEVLESGSTFSGGQRQRIALARALAANAEVLVLQDPITAVDSVTAASIVENIRRLRAEKITLVVSPAPIWQLHADAVLDEPEFYQRLNALVQDAQQTPAVGKEC